MRSLPVLNTDTKFLEVVSPHEKEVLPFLHIHPLIHISSYSKEKVFRCVHPICGTSIAVNNVPRVVVVTSSTTNF
jgi:hypothetical protein